MNEFNLTVLTIFAKIASSERFCCNFGLKFLVSGFMVIIAASTGQATYLKRLRTAIGREVCLEVQIAVPSPRGVATYAAK